MEADRLAHVLHLGQVGAPLLVDHAEHDELLGAPHQLGPVLLLQLLVDRGQLPDDRLDHLGDALTQRAQVHLGDRRQQRPGELAHPIPEALEVPGLPVPALAEGGHLLAHHVLQHAEEVGPGVDALQDLAPLAVDDLALLVHDVVVLDDVAPGVEVIALDPGLRALDLAAEHLGLEGHVLVHVQPAHQPLDPLPAEDAQQVVLEGEEESGLPGVALPPGPATELVVDAA